MIISKTMRTLALTILLVPMAARTMRMPSKLDHIMTTAKSTCLFVTTSFLFSTWATLEMNPKTAWKITSIFSAASGILMAGLGYLDYSRAHEEASLRNRVAIGDFKHLLQTDDASTLDAISARRLMLDDIRTGRLTLAFQNSNESPVTLAAKAGDQQIFDALIAQGFKVSKADYKILWDCKLADLKAKEDAAINTTLKAKAASVKKEIEATTARTAVIEKRVAAKKVEIELKALKDQLASNKANQLKNGPIKTAYESVMASQARAQYNACNPSDAYTPWALSETERKNYNASAKSPRAKGLVKE